MAFIQIRIEEDLKRELQRAARSVGLSLSAWVRLELLQQACRRPEEGEKSRKGARARSSRVSGTVIGGLLSRPGSAGAG